MLYRQPTDVFAFDRHYCACSLSKTLPGLRRYAISRNNSSVHGDESSYLVAELDWDDMNSLRREFASQAGGKTAEDVQNLERLCTRGTEHY